MMRRLLVASVLLMMAALANAQQDRPRVIVKVNDPVFQIEQVFELSKDAQVTFEKYRLQRPQDIQVVDLGLSVKWCSKNYYVTDQEGNEIELFDITDNQDFVASDWGELFDEPWRIPTEEEFKELIDPNNCEWTFDEEQNGFWVSSKIETYEGNMIFFPCSGLKKFHSQVEMEGVGNYWLSPLESEGSNEAPYYEIAYIDRTGKTSFNKYITYKTTAMSIHPVFGAPVNKVKPVVQSASSHDYLSAIVTIDVENVDYNEIIDCGVYYALSESLLPTNKNPQTNLRPVAASWDANGISDVTLNNLTSGATYYVCAYVTTAKGTVYSEPANEVIVKNATIGFSGTAKNVKENTATVTLSMQANPPSLVRLCGVHVTDGNGQQLPDAFVYNPSGQTQDVVLENLSATTYYTCTPYMTFNGSTIEGSGSLSFTTTDTRRVNERFPIPDEPVDMGLPSGTKWSPYNLHYEDLDKDSVLFFFGWGDPDGTKNSTGNDYAEPQILNIAGTKYDIASKQWNDTLRGDTLWRLPTRADFEELYAYCTAKDYTDEKGVGGLLFTNKTDPTKTLFFPLLGQMNGLNRKISNVGTDGFYWTSEASTTKMAYMLRLLKALTNQNFELNTRGTRGCIRPVYGEVTSGNINPDPTPDPNPEPEEDHTLDIGGYDIETPDGGPAEDAQTAYPMEAVDLELPSGTKWAAWNVGAMKYGDLGKYYAWGETTTKETFTNNNYNASVKGALVHNLPSSADVAQQLWGKGSTDNGYWTMPDEDDFAELFMQDPMNPDSLLYVSVRWEMDEAHGYHYGMRVISRQNGNSIFFPAGGFMGTSNNGIDKEGWYWSSSGSGLNNKRQSHAICLNFGLDSTQPDGMYHDGSRNLERFFGFFVRPVWKENSNARELTTP